MNTKIKNIVISCSFGIFLVLFMIVNIFAKDKEISYEERRKLAQLPEFKIEKLLNGNYFEEMEEYLLDQFYLRENFRKIKTFVNTKIFHEKDNNDIYIVDDGIYKTEYKLNENSIYNSANLYNKIAQTYFKNSNIYYTIVPDKNYFVAQKNGYLHLDYEKLINIMKNNTHNMDYIDITNDLKIGDYYRTDLHWKQENLTQVADKILKSMDNDKKRNDAYRKKVFDSELPFRKLLEIDYTLQVQGALRGGMLYLNDCMADYRFMSVGSWSVRYNNEDVVNAMNVRWIAMTNQLDIDTDRKYHDIIQRYMDLREVDRLLRFKHFEELRSYKSIYKKLEGESRKKYYVMTNFPRIYTALKKVRDKVKNGQ